MSIVCTPAGAAGQRTAEHKLLLSHDYCEICRDKDDLDGNNAVDCTMCGGSFHTFCYSQTYDPKRLGKQPFVCEPCYLRFGENECIYCRRVLTISPEQMQRTHVQLATA